MRCFFIGVPVGYAIIFTATILYFFYNGGSGDSAILLQRMFDGLNSFPLLAIPIFLLTGNLMNSGGITLRIFRFASALVGHFRLGLAQVNVVASMIFAGMSGSATVDAAALGAVEIPAMLDAGYDRDYSAAVTAASATLGPIIPPSVPLVIYGIVAEVSIGRLLFAGVVPGIVIGATLMILIAIQGRRGGYAKGRFKGFAHLWKSFKEGILPLLTPVILLGGILLGVFTPTEAAGVALFYAIVLAMAVYREVSVMRLWELIMQTFRPTVEIMVIIAGANAFAYMIMSARLPQDVAQFVMSFSLNKYTLLIVINLALLVVGCFMETVAAITICVPILMPLVIQYGINPDTIRPHRGVQSRFRPLDAPGWDGAFRDEPHCGDLRFPAGSGTSGFLYSALVVFGSDHLHRTPFGLASDGIDGREQVNKESCGSRKLLIPGGRHDHQLGLEHHPEPDRPRYGDPGRDQRALTLDDQRERQRVVRGSHAIPAIHHADILAGQPECAEGARASDAVNLHLDNRLGAGGDHRPAHGKAVWRRRCAT